MANRKRITVGPALELFPGAEYLVRVSGQLRSERKLYRAPEEVVVYAAKVLTEDYPGKRFVLVNNLSPEDDRLGSCLQEIVDKHNSLLILASPNGKTAARKLLRE